MTSSVTIAVHRINGPPAVPTPEYPRSPDLLDKVEKRSTSFIRLRNRIPLTAFEAAEALFVRHSNQVDDVRDLRGRDVVIVHTIAKATNLPVVGHAVFSAALIRAQHPRSLRSVIVAEKGDADVESVAKRHGVETFLADELGRTSSPPVIT